MKTKHELEINFETRLLLKNLLKDLLAEDHPETNKALIEIIDALIRSGGKCPSVEKTRDELEKLYHAGHQENRYVAYALALLLSYERIYPPTGGFFISPAIELETYFRYYPENEVAKENREKRIFELYKIAAKMAYLPAYRELYSLRNDDYEIKQAIECTNRVKKELSQDPKQHEIDHRKRNFIKYLYAFCEEYGISREEISKKECEDFRALGTDIDYAAPDPVILVCLLHVRFGNKIRQSTSIAFVTYFMGYCFAHGILSVPPSSKVILHNLSPEEQDSTPYSYALLRAKPDPKMLIEALQDVFLSQVRGYALKLQLPNFNEEILTAIISIIERRDCHLQSLSISLENPGDTVDIMSLVAAIQRNRNLATLSLNGFNVFIPRDSLFCNENITALDISGNDNFYLLYTSAIRDRLAKNKTLVRLKVNDPTYNPSHHNRSPLTRLACFFAALSENNSLTFLDLSYILLEPKDVAALGTVLTSNVSIRELDISHAEMGRYDNRPICDMLRHNRTITAINLSHNTLSDNSIMAIAIALKENQTLCKLDLRGNEMFNLGISGLAIALRASKTITELKVDKPGDYIPEESAVEFMSSLGVPGNSLRALHFSFDKCCKVLSTLTTLKNVLQHNKTLTSCPITLSDKILRYTKMQTKMILETCDSIKERKIFTDQLSSYIQENDLSNNLSQEITLMVKANKTREETLCFYWSQIAIAASFMRANTPEHPFSRSFKALLPAFHRLSGIRDFNSVRDDEAALNGLFGPYVFKENP